MRSWAVCGTPVNWTILIESSWNFRRPPAILGWPGVRACPVDNLCLTSLFEHLQRRGVGFESLRDKIDLSTPAGRLMANVLASVAAYENEVRSERIVAGQAVARARGKRWGGSQKGRRLKVTDEQMATVRRMHAEGETKVAMARATGLSRPTVYALLGA